MFFAMQPERADENGTGGCMFVFPKPSRSILRMCIDDTLTAQKKNHREKLAIEPRGGLNPGEDKISPGNKCRALLRTFCATSWMSLRLVGGKHEPWPNQDVQRGYARIAPRKPSRVAQSCLAVRL
jgi:hypothetical protein